MALKMSRGVTIKQKQVNTKRVCAWHGQNVAYGVQLEREREREKVIDLEMHSQGSPLNYLFMYLFLATCILVRPHWLGFGRHFKIYLKKNSKCCL